MKIPSSTPSFIMVSSLRFSLPRQGQVTPGTTCMSTPTKNKLFLFIGSMVFLVVLLISTDGGTSSYYQKQVAIHDHDNDANKDDDDCNLSTDLAHLQTPASDYPRQRVSGPMQADEMLTIFSLVRTSSIKRVLEVGGLRGDSAYNFLQALRCKNYDNDNNNNSVAVYTVDVNPVKTWEQHLVPHKTMVKDATTLTLQDLDGKPVDAVLLDCHAFYATQNIIRNLMKNNFLSPQGFFILHDTGLHPPMPVELVPEHKRNIWLQQSDPLGIVHQPVERLIAQWLQTEDCAFQRVSLHDDSRPDKRHGITIMQRRVNLDVNDCSTGQRGRAMVDYEPRDCEAAQAYTRTTLQETCPMGKKWV
jgi:hypothetical protein